MTGKESPHLAQRMHADELSRCLDRFEEAWLAGSPPEIAKFLPAGDGDQSAAVSEFVKIDLEYRWRGFAREADNTIVASTCPALEDYASRYPALGPMKHLPLDLVGEEYRVRHRWGDRPAHKDYLVRFPARSSALERLLTAIDAELLRERSTAGPKGGAPPPNCPEAEQLSAYASGRLRGDVREEIQAHVETCTGCRTSVAVLANRSSSPAPDRAPSTVIWDVEPDEANTRSGSDADWNQSPRCVVLKEVGRGGLGIVSLAHDSRLKRDVAIKELLSDADVSPEMVDRFLFEAQVTGQLEHPGIVPVYDAGINACGSPYYIMRYLRGRTLAQAIDACHSLSRTDPSRSLRLSELLRAFVGVCHAVAFAHSRGVLHRDLKPHNVMLGDYGEAILVDWGLAKAQGAPDSVMDSFSSRSSVRARAVSDASRATPEPRHSETRAGSTLGTPAYMSPEQARGDLARVTARSDIFSLGAILYEILVGRPPLQGRNTTELIENAKAGRFERPRSAAKDVPPALEAVSLKAMACQPEDRYRTAKQLAEEIARWQAGEPVEAWTEPWRLRAARWIRRHRALCTSSAAVLVASCLMLAAWRVGERHRLEELGERARGLLRDGQDALSEGDAERARLLSSNARQLLRAEAAFADIGTDVERLFDQADRLLEEEQQRSAARARYATFHTLRDEALFHGTLYTSVNARDTAIDVQTHLNAAREAARKALGLYLPDPETATAPRVDSPHLAGKEKEAIVSGCDELRLLLARTMSHGLPDRGRKEQRRQARSALRILDGVSQSHSTTRAYHIVRSLCLSAAGDEQAAADERRLADSVPPTTVTDYLLLSHLQYQEGDIAGAAENFRRALRLNPDHFWAQYFLGVCSIKLGRPREAVAYLTAALAHGERPGFPWVHLLRGYAHGQLGALDPAEYEAAEADFVKAIAIDPESYAIYINRAVMWLERGQFPEALADLEHAIALSPARHEAYVNLAEVYRRQQQYDRAIETAERAMRIFPTSAQAFRIRGLVHREREELDLALADFRRAAELEPPKSPARAEDRFEIARILHRQKRYEEALAEQNAVLEVDPDHHGAQRLRTELLLALGQGAQALEALEAMLDPGETDPQLYRLRGFERARIRDHAGAIADYTQALKFEPANPDVRARRGWAWLNSAAELALRDFDTAIEADPKNGDLYTGRGFARVLLGQDTEAVADAEEALRHSPASSDPRERYALKYNAACIYAQASARAGFDPTARPETAQSYSRRALELVREALDQHPAEARGTAFAAMLRDPALAPLHRDEGWQQLRERYSGQTEGADRP